MDEKQLIPYKDNNNSFAEKNNMIPENKNDSIQQNYEMNNAVNTMLRNGNGFDFQNKQLSKRI